MIKTSKMDKINSNDKVKIAPIEKRWSAHANRWAQGCN